MSSQHPPIPNTPTTPSYLNRTVSQIHTEPRHPPKYIDLASTLPDFAPRTELLPPAWTNVVEAESVRKNLEREYDAQ